VENDSRDSRDSSLCGRIQSRLEIRRSGLVRSLGILQRPKTRPSGPVWSWVTAETGPPKDQDRGLVLVFERSWSDRTTDGVKNRNYRY
jgi:hypothetical protein